MINRRIADRLHIITRAVLVIVLSAALVLLPMKTAKADVATDTLTIKVGYAGMQLSEYVEAGTYNWRDLVDTLTLHEVAYSYFQSSSRTKYNAIVDSARGFYITDLLDLASIYYGDVISLKFYVEDSQGIRTSFDRDALFTSRYYYDDLAGHREVVYGKKTVTEEQTETVHHDAVYETETYVDEETGEVMTREVLVTEAYDEEVVTTTTKEVDDLSNIIEYRFDEAGRYATQVEPMLAIEDNWAQFNEEFEHIGPDFSYLNAGNRFRLLFGQTSPTESLTSKSDKYVSCVYVTLAGKPEIGEMEELDGKYGSHTVDMTVRADNTNVRDALSELMNVTSTNTDVLVITGIAVTPDSRYSDLAKVTVSYDIVGEGEASIAVGVGIDSEPLAVSKTIIAGKDSSEGEDSPPGQDEQDDGKEPDSGETADKPDDNKSDEQAPADKPADSKSDEKGPADGQKSAVNNVIEKPEQIKEEKELKAEEYGPRAFWLSDEASANLRHAMMERPEVAAAEEEDIEKVVVEDRTDEEKERNRRVLVLTGIGCLLACAGGGAAEVLSFNMRLKGRKKIS